MIDEYVPFREVAERAKVSLPTAYKYVRDGTIPGRRVLYGRTRVSRQVFETWLKTKDL